jgi:hypothetical protein
MLTIQLGDFPAEGIRLISPTDSDFEARARPRIGARANLALKLKPFVAVVFNQSARTIVAVATRWQVTRRFGGERQNYCHHRYPEGVFGAGLSRSSSNDDPILPGQERVVSHGWALEQWPEGYDYLLRNFRWAKYRDLWCASKLRIELDTVILDDGLILGSGESKLAEHFEACVRAREYWYGRTLHALESGKSVEEAMEPAETVLEQMQRPALSIDPFEVHWQQQAAAEVRNVLRKGRDEATARLRRALSRVPFVIRRAQGA